MTKKLYRDEQNKSVGGVCIGLAEYFNVDVSIVRALFVLALVLKGTGVLLYIILWAVLPKKPFTFAQPGVDYMVSPEGDATAPPFVTPPPRRKSHAGLIGGIALIVVGAGLLLDEFDIIPDFDFDQLWPVVLVIIGAVLIFTSAKSNKPNIINEPKPPIE